MAYFICRNELVIRHDADEHDQYDQHHLYELRDGFYHHVCSVGCGYAGGWRELSADEVSRLRIAVTAS